MTIYKDSRKGGGTAMKMDRVPPRLIPANKKRYGRHREGAVPLTIWEDRGLKEMLREEAKRVELPKWTLSDHVSYILRDHLGVWDKPYRPILKKPTNEASILIIARR
jgi:hypothetical protein